MHLSVFTQLSVIITFAAAIALIMRLIRQPLIIGYILTGIIVGPSVLHLVKSPDTIEVFSSIGIALLLFIIGLGLNPRVIKEVGRVAAITGIIQVATTAFFAWGGGIILGLSRTESVFFGVALAFSSTIIILKLLSDKKEQNRLYGKIVTGLLLVQDLLAILALIFVNSRSGGNFSFGTLGWLAIKGLLITTPIFLVSTHVLPRLHHLIAGSREFLFLFAIGWGFGISSLFERAGFSLEIGALIAGIALASLPYTQEIAARLRPLRDFFVIVFFIALGTRISFSDISLLIPAIIMGVSIVAIFKPVVVMVIMGLMGYTKRTSFKTAISLAQVSEFSLVFVVLGNKFGMVSDNLIAIITIVALITIAASSYMIIYSDKLYRFFELQLALFERRKTHFEQESRHHFELVLFGYQKGGHEFVKVFEALKKRYVVVDYDPEVIDALEHNKVNYLYGDAMDIELLEEIGLDKSKLVVSVVTDHQTNLFLLNLMEKINPHAVVILHAESVEEAAELYELGASYVVIPHYIGNEKISAFIKRNGLDKGEFKKYRERHLAYLKSNFDVEPEM